MEIHQQLLACAFCESISMYVCEAMRRGSGKRRTDVRLWGVCEEHHDVFPLQWALEGYEGFMCVEWSAAGELLHQLEAGGLLR